MEVLVRLPDGTETYVPVERLKTFLRLNPGAEMVDRKAVKPGLNKMIAAPSENKSA